VTLLGDAAHAALPTLGQGAGQAIEDAAVLAHRVAARGNDVPGALREYEQRRMPRTKKVIDEAWTISRSYRWTNPLAVWGRDTALRLTPNGVFASEQRAEAALDLFADAVTT
jgi:2-polyprenyl-6-methoxyphenol hydroxylase-like FAD-dependent oxidoreductase